jgi:twitching motility protein PilI
MDLQGFLGQSLQPIGGKTRVLVVRRDELAVGLVVNEVLGLKHFQEEEKITAVTAFDESLRNYVHGAFRQKGEEIMVFSMYALVDNPYFFQVAV